MHEHMIKEWNAVVKPEDIVIHLGDFICGGTFDQVKEIVDQLNGRKILITGNHDRKGKKWFKRAGFQRVFKHRWNVGMYCFSHRPQDALYLEDHGARYNLHGHSHNHHYGDPFYNFGVDVVGYNPKKVKMNLVEDDLLKEQGRHSNDKVLEMETKIRDKWRQTQK